MQFAAVMVTQMVVEKERPRVVARARLMEVAKAKLKEVVRLLVAVMVMLMVVEKAKLKEVVRLLMAVMARMMAEAEGQRDRKCCTLCTCTSDSSPLGPCHTTGSMPRTLCR